MIGTPTFTRFLRLSLPVAVLASLFAACGQTAESTDDSEPVSATFEQVFEIEDVVELQEDPADSIAELGAFAELRDGGFVVGDNLLPRIRRYAENGRLVAAFGRFGDGPFEFRWINSVTETASGAIVVPNSLQSNLTYLTSDLQSDTLVPIPGPATSAIAMDRDLIVRMTRAADHDTWFDSRGRPPILHRLIDGELAWSSFNYPFLTHERPYWSSMVGTPIAVSGDSIYAMSGARFPATILNVDGDTVGVIGEPSESFRPIPVLEGGALAGPEAYGASFGDFLASFEFIHRIDVVDRHLVFTRATYDPTQGTAFRWSHTVIDLYDRHTGIALYQDVPLPENSVVLGGGRFLYLLINKEFPPWRVARLRVRDEGSGTANGRGHRG